MPNLSLEETNKLMAAMAKENEAINKRFQEVEADKLDAEKSNASVSLAVKQPPVIMSPPHPREFTGSQYVEWKAERNKIDQERIARASQGAQREWDVGKVNQSDEELDRNDYYTKHPKEKMLGQYLPNKGASNKGRGYNQRAREQRSFKPKVFWSSSVTSRNQQQDKPLDSNRFLPEDKEKPQRLYNKNWGRQDDSPRREKGRKIFSRSFDHELKEKRDAFNQEGTSGYLRNVKQSRALNIKAGFQKPTKQNSPKLSRFETSANTGTWSDIEEDSKIDIHCEKFKTPDDVEGIKAPDDAALNKKTGFKTFTKQDSSKLSRFEASANSGTWSDTEEDIKTDIHCAEFKTSDDIEGFKAPNDAALNKNAEFQTPANQDSSTRFETSANTSTWSDIEEDNKTDIHCAEIKTPDDVGGVKTPARQDSSELSRLEASANTGTWSDIEEDIKTDIHCAEFKALNDMEGIKAPHEVEVVNAPDDAEWVKAPDIVVVNAPDNAEGIEAPDNAEGIEAPDKEEGIEAPDKDGIKSLDGIEEVVKVLNVTEIENFNQTVKDAQVAYSNEENFGSGSLGKSIKFSIITHASAHRMKSHYLKKTKGSQDKENIRKNKKAPQGDIEKFKPDKNLALPIHDQANLYEKEHISKDSAMESSNQTLQGQVITRKDNELLQSLTGHSLHWTSVMGDPIHSSGLEVTSEDSAGNSSEKVDEGQGDNGSLHFIPLTDQSVIVDSIHTSGLEVTSEDSAGKSSEKVEGQGDSCKSDN